MNRSIFAICFRFLFTIALFPLLYALSVPRGYYSNDQKNAINSTAFSFDRGDSEPQVGAYFGPLNTFTSKNTLYFIVTNENGVVGTKISFSPSTWLEIPLNIYSRGFFYTLKGGEFFSFLT